MASHDADNSWTFLISVRAAARLMLTALLAGIFAAPATSLQRSSALSEPHYHAAPVLRAGFCPDGAPCRVDEEPSYEPHNGRARNWRPAAHGAGAYEAEPATVHIEEDCVEEQPRSYRYVAHPPQAYEGRGWDEPCGIRCWYKKLRAGYCGRGCDYYRFRLTEFPEGKLSRYRHHRAACKIER